jgi:hypothetical protein
MTLKVTNATERAGFGDMGQPFCDRDEIFGQGCIKVHPSLGIVAYVMKLFPRGTKPSPEVVDLAHSVMPALGGRSHNLIIRLGHTPPPGAELGASSLYLKYFIIATQP